MDPQSAGWANFFAAEVGASAALTGLLVVAISINLARILAIAQLPGRAAEGLIILVGAFVLSSVALIPDQSAAAFATEVLISGLVMVLAPLSIQLRSWKATEGVSRARQVIRLVVNMIAGVPVIVAGVLLMSGAGEGFYWMAAGILIALVSAVWNAWVLLVEILR
jgi:modulator of FtsH protease